MNTPDRREPRIGPDTVTPEELAADEFVERALAERLPRIRAAATSWGATVAAITGLFGAGTVIDADDQVRALRHDAGVIYGVLTALAVTAAAATIYLAARAAESRPRPIPRDVHARAQVMDELFDDAVNALRWSRVCAALAVVLLMTSMGVRWFGPLTA